MRPIPSNIGSKINERLQTIANNANPKMELSVSRAKDTVADGTYWAVETIREISGLGDVSVAPRRFNVSGRPNRIYEIHVKDGQVYTSIREYPDKLREGFKTQFSLGPGTTVGLAFNGHWERYRQFYRLITEEKPWISWVDSSGVLWVQRWDEADTKFQLSTNVQKVKMIRGWKNLVILHQDHGIVVGYIKSDGRVYYRNYCIQADGSEAWEYEKELTSFTGVASNVNLFITNDYRMGFMIEDNLGNIHWFVSHRNWGGMASPAEFINTGIRDLKMEVIPIKYHTFYSDSERISTGVNDIWLNVSEPIYPVPVYAENPEESPEKILLRFSHLIDTDPTTVKTAFKIKDADNKEYTIYSTEFGSDASEIIFNMSRFDSAKNDMTITYDRAIVELDCLNQGSRFAIESFNFTFTAVLIPPTGYAEENISADILPSITVKQVYHSSYGVEENINSGVSDITIDVIKVGNNPL